MKYILWCCVLLLGLSSCDNSKELTPRIEEIIDSEIVIPTPRLTYEEQDILDAEQKAFDEALAERASE